MNISKQAVLEIITSYLGEGIDGPTLVSMTKSINSLPPISDGWISVDTPPKKIDLEAENENMVLLSHITDKWIVRGYYNLGKYFNDFDADCPCYPTHWQSLPNPPQK